MKLIDVFKMEQRVLKNALANELKSNGYQPESKDGYLYAKGTIPVLLVAHLDTVHKKPPEHIWISKDGDLFKADEGIGGDDRCGVWIILNLIKDLHCSVLFCEDEEIGGIGASNFTRSVCKIDANFIIEFDRKGNNDAVYYNLDNKQFEHMISECGFTTNFGTFSDISILAPKLGVAAVNLSSGYYNAHTENEYVSISDMKSVIQRARKIIAHSGERFEYVGYAKSNDWYYDCYDDMFIAEVMPFDGVIKFSDGEMLESNEMEGDYVLGCNGELYEYDYYDGVYIRLDDDVRAVSQDMVTNIVYDKEKAFPAYVYDYAESQNIM